MSLGLGTTEQPKVRARGQRKAAKIKQKHSTYHRHVSNYNQLHSPVEPIADPTLDEVKSMPITDMFWDRSGLTHPDKAWAT